MNLNGNYNTHTAFTPVHDELGLSVQKSFISFLLTCVPADYVPEPNNNSQDEPQSTMSDNSEFGTNSSRYYVRAIYAMVETELSTLVVDYTHLRDHDHELAQIVIEHFHRLEPYLANAISTAVSTILSHHKSDPKIRSILERRERIQYFLSVEKLPRAHSLRELNTAKIGALSAINGTVTRTSTVRPELLNGVFKCLDCNSQSAPIRQQFKYTEPLVCTNSQCPNRSKWELNVSLSTFVDWQTVKVQENANEIPPGSMPRSMRVILRNELVESIKPGDKVVLTGCLLVIPDVSQLNSNRAAGGKGKGNAKSAGSGGNVQVQQDNRAGRETGGISGLKELGVRELSYSLTFLAVHSDTGRKKGMGSGGNGSLQGLEDETLEDVWNDFTKDEQSRLQVMKSESRLYSRLVNSFAPNIFGHDEIKRGLLLMLLGGVHKQTADGANLRGDINVCIVGDPSTSKSQFLKYICTFLPRAVYTSGKASSAAGLTASVVRDVESGEFSIEAGALMLADHSICCIDEFDKMEITDQVAIHEAMEQQTISIAKAGIQATLNARTAVLAAANPIKGRYDRSKTLRQNVDISAPIMSRFDLFFVVLDEMDEAVDLMLARHIIDVHVANLAGDITGSAYAYHGASQAEFSMAELRNYIRIARTFKPVLTPEAREYLVGQYVQLRGADSTGINNQSYRITVRQLESLIRLSEARARLDWSESVEIAHVREAARLLKKSIVKVEAADISIDDYQDDSIGEMEWQPPEEEVKEQESAQPANQDSHATNGAATKAPERKIELSADEYRRISLLLLSHLRRQETPENPSMTQGDLMEWYLSEKEAENDMITESELLYFARVVRAVIHQMIEVDHSVLTDKTNTQSQEAPLTAQERNKLLRDRRLRVHPNWVLEAPPAAQHLEEES